MEENEVLIDDSVFNLDYYINVDVVVFHVWGDSWFVKNGKTLGEAMDLILDKMNRYRIRLMECKEKYGTFRCEVSSLWDGTIRFLINPYSYPEDSWYDKIDSKIASFFKKTGILKKVNNWQKSRINKIYQEICKEHPEILNELIVDINFEDWIIPGKYGIIDGKTIQNKYWTKITNTKVNQELESL